MNDPIHPDPVLPGPMPPDPSSLPFPSIPPPSGIYPPGTLFPMTLGHILERVSRILRSRWKPLAAIGAAPIGLMFLAEALFFLTIYLSGGFKIPPAPPDFPINAWLAIPFDLILIPAFFAMYGLYYGASSYAALQADRDLPVTFVQAYAHAWSRLGRYTWLMILRTLIIGLPMIPLFAIFALCVFTTVGLTGHGTQNPGVLFLLVPLGMLLYLGAVVYAVIMSLRLSLANCACVHEGLTARQAIARSGFLTQGAKGRIFLVLLVIYAISYAVMMVIYLVGIMAVVVVAGVFSISAHSLTPLGIAAIAVLGLCVAVFFIFWIALLMAAYAVSFAVLYRDQCLRRDGPQPLPGAASTAISAAL